MESNITLEAKTILSVLNKTTELRVTDAKGLSHTVTLLHSELVAGIVKDFFHLIIIQYIVCEKEYD